VSRAPSARRRALAGGVAAVLAYLALAALSGHLSPLARHPLLDGYSGNPVQYNWVTPPPELAGTNQPPTSGDFTLKLTDRGTRPGVFTTGDAQVTLIPVAGTFPSAPGQDAVHLTVTPIDASTVSPPAEPLEIVGNVIELTATYEPSGDPIDTMDKPLETILVYPLPPNVHTSSHTLIFSPDGKTWERSDGTDSTAIQQVEGPVRTLGYVAAAADVSATSSSTPAGMGGSSSTLGIALIVGAVCAALIGVGLLLRGREPSERR
jgi:hypothetical protein